MKYWLWLTTRGLTARQSFSLYEQFKTPEAIFFAEEKELSKCNEITQVALTKLRDKRLDRPRRILEDCYSAGIRLLTIGDGEYPDRLRNIYDPPLLLYVLGKLPPIQEIPALAVVGTRRPGPRGVSAVRKLSRELAASGLLIVSGMALGIDAAAHEGALDVGMPTLAVLGSGVDVIYPQANRSLYRQILSCGAVISEYPPGTPPNAHHFPVRNRIITGLCDAVLVGRAPKRSGALISARLATEQGREVFFLPGEIDDPACEGSNALGTDGATMVTCAADILREYLPLYPTSFHIRKPVEQHQPAPEKAERLPVSEQILPKEKIKNCTPVQQVLLQRLQEGDCQLDALLSLSGLRSDQVIAELTMLQLNGLIEQYPGKRFGLKKTERGR